MENTKLFFRQPEHPRSKKSPKNPQPAPMPLFDFTLKNLAATARFNHRLSWFWLTDGSNDICINGRRLLSYHPAPLTDGPEEEAAYLAECRANGLPPYQPDYYVVRLYEDVLSEALPYVQADVPPLLHELLLRPQAYRIWEEAYYDTDTADFPPALPVGGFGGGHMVMPAFRVWRFGGEVYIYRDGSLNNEAGLPWFADTDETVFVLPHKMFMDEVADFHRRLMNAMEARIAEIADLQEQQPEIARAVDYGAATVAENLALLRAEHQKRCRSLEQALAQAAPPRFQPTAAETLRLEQLSADYPHALTPVAVSSVQAA